MDSGDEEEENQEEPEVRSRNILYTRMCRSLASDLLTASFISVLKEKTKSTKGRRGAKIAKLGTICCSFEIKHPLGFMG